MNKSLIDTDISSEITKGVNPTVVAHASAYRMAFSRYTISAVTLMEVIRGYQKKQAARQLQHFLISTTGEEVIPLDRQRPSSPVASPATWHAQASRLA